MKIGKTLILYGIALAVMTAILKFIEYRYYVRDLSLEMYVGLVAAIFIGLGVWIGVRVTRKTVKSRIVEPVDAARIKEIGITMRELEVLQLIAEGHSNREIADKLFVSTSTVKTHSSNLFFKLDARRRTQAIQRAKELRLIP